MVWASDRPVNFRPILSHPMLRINAHVDVPHTYDANTLARKTYSERNLVFVGVRDLANGPELGVALSTITVMPERCKLLELPVKLRWDTSKHAFRIRDALVEVDVILCHRKICTVFVGAPDRDTRGMAGLIENVTQITDDSVSAALKSVEECWRQHEVVGIDDVGSCFRANCLCKLGWVFTKKSNISRFELRDFCFCPATDFLSGIEQRCYHSDLLSPLSRTSKSKASLVGIGLSLPTPTNLSTATPHLLLCLLWLSIIFFCSVRAPRAKLFDGKRLLTIPGSKASVRQHHRNEPFVVTLADRSSSGGYSPACNSHSWNIRTGRDSSDLGRQTNQ